MVWIAPRLTDGLGNRLFQYAAAAGLAEKWNWPLVFFLPQCGPTNHGRFETIFKLFPTVPLIYTEPEWESVSEPLGHIYKFCELPAEPLSQKVHVLQGYRQSEKYFPKEGICLNFENALGSEKIRQLREQITDPFKTWFIHIRLGDYKLLPHHQQPLDFYYSRCLVEIPRGCTLVLMSDEPKLCQEMFAEACVHLGLEFVVCDTPDELASLYLMSLCKGGAITSNSTFGWWGAYCAHQDASPTFRAFYPSKWGKGMPLPEDVVPSWGMRVDVE
jgi:hypothetical protein